MKATTKGWMIGCMAAALVLSPAVADAAGWGSGNGESPEVEDLIPSMASGQAYSERYTFAVDLDGGGHVGMDWTISNLGLRSGYGASEVRVRLPDRENFEHSEKKSRGDWSYDEDSFGLDIAGATVEAVDEGAFELRYEGDDVRVELRFENTIDMWRPGGGGIERGDDFYRFTMVSPRADVSGRLYYDGEWHEVTGSRSGYADHVETNVAPYDLATRFTRFRQYDDEVFVMWREVSLTDEFGGGSPSWIVVGVGDEIVYEDTSPEVRFGDVQQDEETGYYVPDAVQVAGDNGEGELLLTLRKEESNRTDLLDEHGRVVRFIASAVSEPYQYDIHGDYALKVEVGDNRLRTMDSGHVTIDYVNQ